MLNLMDSRCRDGHRKFWLLKRVLFGGHYIITIGKDGKITLLKGKKAEEEEVSLYRGKVPGYHGCIPLGSRTSGKLIAVGDLIGSFRADNS